MSVQLQDLRTHDHPCLIYETKAEKAAAFVPYLQAGLVLQEKCLYIFDETSPESIVEALRANDFPIDDYITRGALAIISKNDAYLQNGYFDTQKMCTFWSDAIKTANDAGFVALRAAAEMSWALGAEPGCNQLVGYESHLNNVFPNAKVSALCLYDRRKFDAQIIKEMIHVHPLIVIDGDVIANPGFRKPADFVQSHADTDVQALLDNLTMTKQLADTNTQLREALLAQERAQAIIEERNKECEYLYEELQSLAKVVSQELQAPLTVMQSYLRLISVRYKSKLGPDADEFIQKSVSASKVVGKMIDDLWSYARVEQYGENKVDQLDTAEVLGESLQDLQPLIEASSAHIESVTKLPTIKASREHLRIVFNALLSNSIKYARSGCPPEIKIGAKEDAENWLFFVRDNGCGVDSTHALDVFRLFHRLNAKPGEDGTGMGLAICRRVIDHYRGKIWFDSLEFEYGTTIWFSIPKRDMPDTTTSNVRSFSSAKGRGKRG